MEKQIGYWEYTSTKMGFGMPFFVATGWILWILCATIAIFFVSGELAFNEAIFMGMFFGGILGLLIGFLPMFHRAINQNRK